MNKRGDKMNISYLKNKNIHFVECKDWHDVYGYEKSEMKEDTINYIEQLEQQCKKQKEVIDRIKEYINPLITDKDDKEYYPINFYVKDVLLSILKEVSE